MPDANHRPLRILHLVSSGGVAGALQQSLFMPLLTRMPRQRIAAQVVCFARGIVPEAVLRQHGVPVHDVALSRRGFSLGSVAQLLSTTRSFHPDVIQAWGHTAQIASTLLRGRCAWKPRVVWSVAETVPLPPGARAMERRKLALAVRNSTKADRIVYTSQAGAAQHRRAGFPDGGHLVVPPGVDAVRFRPDAVARRRLREQLQLGPDAFVVGMVAPFQAEYDHATLLKAGAELLKTHPQLSLVLAGHGVQKGNPALMALLGSGALGARTHLLGERSDMVSFFNACDVVCSSALNDSSRMSLAMAMLCGVPCVATGMGAQGEVIGQHGIAIEPGNPAAFVRGITRVMQLSPERRAQMAQGARKHVLRHYVHVRSVQKYLRLYQQLLGYEAAPAEQDSATHFRRTTARLRAAEPLPAKPIFEPATGGSSEPKTVEAPVASAPTYRPIPQERPANQQTKLTRQVASSDEVDVLQAFEAQLAKLGNASPQGERARGVVEDTEDLLAPEMLTIPVVSNTQRTVPQVGEPAASAFQLELLDEPPAEQPRRATVSE